MQVEEESKGYSLTSQGSQKGSDIKSPNS